MSFWVMREDRAITEQECTCYLVRFGGCAGAPHWENMFKGTSLIRNRPPS